MPVPRVLLSTFSLVAIAASVAFAQSTPRASIGGITPPAQTSNQNGNAAHQRIAENNGACQRIVAECERQGFIKGQWKKDNGLWKDCFDPVMKGGQATQGGHPVPVSVSPSDIQECRTAEGHHKHTQARAY